jgi:hypothetical protein
MRHMFLYIPIYSHAAWLQVDHFLQLPEKQIPPHVEPALEVDPFGKVYAPVIHFNDFWLMREHLLLMNDTVTEVSGCDSLPFLGDCGGCDSLSSFPLFFLSWVSLMCVHLMMTGSPGSMLQENDGDCCMHVLHGAVKFAFRLGLPGVEGNRAARLLFVGKWLFGKDEKAEAMAACCT